MLCRILSADMASSKETPGNWKSFGWMFSHFRRKADMSRPWDPWDSMYGIFSYKGTLRKLGGGFNLEIVCRTY